ncbi:MAG: hypothetical protein AB7L94_26140 [Kofleriaceae bacterium]
MLKAIIATLVLGASGAAVADPGPGITIRGEARWGQPAPVQTYQRDHRPHWRNNTWVALTSPLQLDRGRTVIDVNQRRPFQQLRLQQTSYGMSRIDRVIVRFENGERQVINVNQRLSTRNPMVNIDLDGRMRRVDRIVVMGDSRRGSAIQVFGI